MSDGVWEYTETSTKKHFFYSDKHLVTLCGVSKAYTVGGEWKSDGLGLKMRKPCVRCILLMEKTYDLRRQIVLQNTGRGTSVRPQNTQTDVMVPRQVLSPVARKLAEDVDWKYLEGGKSKHFFLEPKNHASACGRKPVWYARWLDDEKGLKERKYCLQCLGFLVGEN
jgi:hypothetical protein